MTELLVVAVLDEASTGDTFTMWPLHMTVLPWFETETAEVAFGLLKPIVRQHRPMEIKLGDFANFGATRTVRLVLPSAELKALHQEMLRAVQTSSWEIRGRYTGDHFSPHITRTGGRDFQGDRFVINKLYLAEALPMGKRRLVAELPLKGIANIAIR